MQNTYPGDLAKAEAILARCRTAASARNFRGRLIEIDALDAIRCAEMGQIEEALALLTGSVTRAESGGALRILLDVGIGLRPLLQELLVRNVAPAFIGRLLAAYPVDEVLLRAASSHAPMTHALVPVEVLLTNREMDVLLLLSERLTNKEIATILTLTPRTVKKHTINIYQKLHVDNRRAAVNAARAKGLLPAL
ncbi:MAG: response regulator transcription factor [Anaerolineales bacterium]|nr:response regulator transcription factor [Anaerolineales bacterium]